MRRPVPADESSHTRESQAHIGPDTAGLTDGGAVDMFRSPRTRRYEILAADDRQSENCADRGENTGDDRRLFEVPSKLAAMNPELVARARYLATESSGTVAATDRPQSISGNVISSNRTPVASVE